MDKYNNVIWRLHCRWVCCNIVPSSVSSTLSVQVKPTNASVAGPGLRLVAPRGGTRLGKQTSQVRWMLARDCRGFRFWVVWNKRLFAQRQSPCKQRFQASPTECEPEELQGGAEEPLWPVFSLICEEPLFIGLIHRSIRR